MEPLLRGSVGAISLSGAVALPRLSLSRELSQCRLIVSQARATGADGLGESTLMEVPSKHPEIVVVSVTTSKNEESAEFVLLSCVEDDTSVESESVLLSMSPLSILALGVLPGAEQITDLFTPYAELIRTWHLQEWLVHWGHPGNMAVVLFAMGGYGTYLGWQIRVSDNLNLKAKAKDLHPKLFAGLFFFFAAGAVGGVTSLLTQGKSIFESNHALTGVVGLTLLAIQRTLSTQFEGKPELRSVHAYLGSGIMALFLVHAALGLQLGLAL